MNYESPLQQDPGDYPDNLSEKSRKTNYRFIAPGYATLMRDASESSPNAILGDRYANLPLSIAIIILVATPFFGTYIWWMFFSAVVLAVVLVISFIISRWEMSPGLHPSKGG